jgi:hypothetical protein
LSRSRWRCGSENFGSANQQSANDGEAIKAMVPVNPHEGPVLGDPVDVSYSKAGGPQPIMDGLTPDDIRMQDSSGIAWASGKIQKLLGGNIALDMLGARSGTARQLIANLDELSIQLSGEFKGKAAPIAAMQLRARLDGLHATTLKGFLSAYRSYRSGVDLSGTTCAESTQVDVTSSAPPSSS